MKRIPVLLLGCGGVGQRLLDHIVSCRAIHSQQGLALSVVGVCDSRSMLLVDDLQNSEFSDVFLKEICKVKSSESSLSTVSHFGRPCQIFNNPTELAIDLSASLGGSTGLVVVDCSASSETLQILKKSVAFGCCVVMANKKPFTSNIEEYEELTLHFRRIRYESTVGAGLPVISSVTRLLASGDPITRIVGSLSGTLGYVMSEIEIGKPFSEVVLFAKSLGYTEPDPRDDLSGMDVARKALILSRLLGWKIDMDSVQVESLYPDEMGPHLMNTEDFLGSGLALLNVIISERVKAALSKGNVLRYVCMIEDSRCRVGLQELSKESALGRLRGSDNVVEIYSRCYKDSPLVIQGAGAGNDTTAAGVLADIIDFQDLFK
ncbi:Homoserine dehydrogenase [Zostera marina]|uniref:Homoserine dehydrogenase n=1 Tax=Zostera marina TaxID=29655 RepID=A0A0K9PGS9_ZOSMR|nr:Homoserine dehydrogenase [Zostera marina]